GAPALDCVRRNRPCIRLVREKIAFRKRLCFWLARHVRPATEDHDAEDRDKNIQGAAIIPGSTRASRALFRTLAEKLWTAACNKDALGDGAKHCTHGLVRSPDNH